MSELPLVTIMIPTYKQERFIADAIESAMQQTYANLEILITDDCSPDGTQEVVARYIGDARVRYVRHAANIGRVENYRATLGLARGEWVINLDGDDYLIDADYVREAVSVAVSDPGIVLVWGNALVAWEGARTAPLMSSRWGGDPIIMTGERLIMTYPPFLSTISPPHLASLYKRDVAIEAEFYRNDSLCCDSESVYRLGFGGHKVAIMDRVAGVWRQHGGNESHAVDHLHGANVSRANGIMQWAESRGRFSRRELRRLRRTLDAGNGVAWFASAALSGRLRYAPFALARAMLMYPMVAHRIAFWSAQRCARVLMRHVAAKVAAMLSDVSAQVPSPPTTGTIKEANR